MTRKLKQSVLWLLGVLFVLIGLVGVVLPILPTTPFMILAAACFAQSSPRFHRMLLNNRWFGAELQRWETTKTMQRTTKKKATWLIVISFSISIAILWGRPALQVMLLVIAAILLAWMWRIAEETEQSLSTITVAQDRTVDEKEQNKPNS